MTRLVFVLFHPSLRMSGIVLALALVMALVGCASPGGTLERQAAPPEPVAEAPAPPPLTEADREAVLAEISSLMLLAREQARLGLVDDAAETWERLEARLEPLAERDERLAGLLDEVLIEREERLASAEELLDRFDQNGRDSMLEAEPQLDPSQAGEVTEAAQDVEPDWPVEVNDLVVAWLEVYQDSGRLGEYIKQSLARSGRYEQRFREIFAEEGIPQDLIYLAHVESGFKTTAYSRARARGIFQFIASTGRRYGMRVDWWVDERADPEKSCRASATYLRDLYAEFGDWYLALAAYNAGEGRVRRSIRAAGTRDFWELRRRRFFRRETRNYVPAIIAATLISKDPARFGHGDVVKQEPLDYELVTVSDQADIEVLARAAGATAQELRELNPALRRGQTPPKYPDYQLKVPVGKAEGFAEKLAAIPKSEWIVKQLHRVRRGDTLSEIARRYGTSVRAIQLANGMGRRTMLSIGRVLEIPRGPVRGYSRRPLNVAKDGSYRVRRGDTLGRIARRQRVTVAQLQAWNGLGRSTRIVAGERLYVREPGTTTSSAGRGARSLPAGSTVHIVRRGESAWEISQRHGVSLGVLLRANGLSRRSILHPGQKLAIPGKAGSGVATASSSDARVHVVRRGDSLYKIARRYGVTVEQLRSLNNLSRNAIIHPGDRIAIR